MIEDKIYDVIIAGAGPAGMTAVIYIYIFTKYFQANKSEEIVITQSKVVN